MSKCIARDRTSKRSVVLEVASIQGVLKTGTLANLTHAVLLKASFRALMECHITFARRASIARRCSRRRTFTFRPADFDSSMVADSEL
ncbi:hypothetical protein DIE22_36015 [Burkholderia sp. Bp9142]|nr:hypothetical protein DIE22_36015 [Burkholderia sp. Bp9142]